MTYREAAIDEATRAFGVRTSGSALAVRVLATVGFAVLGVGTIHICMAAFDHRPLSWPLAIVGTAIVLCSIGIDHAARRQLIISRTGAVGGLAIEGTAISLQLPIAITGTQTERRVRVVNLGGLVVATWTATLQLVDARGRGVVLRELRRANLGEIANWSDGLVRSKPDAAIPCFDVEVDQLARVRAAVERQLR